MYKLCKTEHSSKRQAQIEKILLELMYRKSFDDIRVSEICEIAEMPRKAFYRYFDSKDGALHALLHHNLINYHAFTAEQRNHKTRTLEGEFEVFFSFWKTKKDFLDAFERSNLTGLLIQSSADYSIVEFMNVRKFLTDEDDWLAGQVFSFSICGLMSIMINWYRSGFSESVQSMASAASRLVSEPLFAALEKNGISVKARKFDN